MCPFHITPPALPRQSSLAFSPFHISLWKLDMDMLQIPRKLNSQASGIFLIYCSKVAHVDDLDFADYKRLHSVGNKCGLAEESEFLFSLWKVTLGKRWIEYPVVMLTKEERIPREFFPRSCFLSINSSATSLILIHLIYPHTNPFPCSHFHLHLYAPTPNSKFLSICMSLSHWLCPFIFSLLILSVFVYPTSLAWRLVCTNEECSNIY